MSGHDYMGLWQVYVMAVTLKGTAIKIVKYVGRAITREIQKLQTINIGPLSSIPQRTMLFGVKSQPGSPVREPG